MLHKTILAVAFWLAVLTPWASAADQDLDRAATLFSAREYDAALEIIQPRANKGDARAQTYLAKMYLGGYGLPKDTSAAMNLLHLAADQSYREAQFMLGVVHAAGEGGNPPDRVEALKWLVIARAKDGLAYNLLVDVMTSGEIHTAEARAEDWKRRTNGKRIREALALTGDDKVSALAALADEGIAAAQYQLGQLYNMGVPDAVASKVVPGLYDLQPNYRKAEELYRKAALQGYAPAQSSLATYLLEGSGVATSATEAVEWLEKASAQSELSAMVQLGEILAAGEIVPKDPSRATALYRKAARKGDAYAMEILGQNYAEGTISEMDLELGYMWLSLASQKYRSEYATPLSEKVDTLLDSLAKLMSQSQIDRAREAADRCLTSSYANCRRASITDWLWSWVGQ